MATVYGQVQMVPPNTWTNVHGTDLQIHVRAAEDTPVELEMSITENGEQYIEVRTGVKTEGEIAIRTPW